MQVLNLEKAGSFLRTAKFEIATGLDELLKKGRVRLAKELEMPDSCISLSLSNNPEQGFAIASAETLGFTGLTSREQIFEKIFVLGGWLLYPDDLFRLLEETLLSQLKGTCVLATDPFLYREMWSLHGVHCGEIILLQPVSAELTTLWNPKVNWIFGL